MEKLSIAMSGGGHRATLFGLGALQYVADAGSNVDVVSVASVSGGSLTNGYVGQNVAYNSVDGAGFERRAISFSEADAFASGARVQGTGLVDRGIFTIPGGCPINGVCTVTRMR